MPGSDRSGGEVPAALGDPRALPLLQELVSIAPTNLEDIPGDRYEKPNYPRAGGRDRAGRPVVSVSRPGSSTR